MVVVVTLVVTVAVDLVEIIQKQDQEQTTGTVAHAIDVVLITQKANYDVV